MLTLPIEIGKKYVRRDGEVVTAKPPHKGVTFNCAFIGIGESVEFWSEHVWCSTGLVYNSYETSDLDLVADYIAENTASRVPPRPPPAPVESDPNGIPANTPGAKLDAGKVRPALVLGGFARALLEVSKVGTGGALKYTDNGWMEVPNGIKRYDDAMLRHWLKEKAGEECDSDTGLFHAAHLAWNSLARLDLLIRQREKGNE